MVDGDRVRNMDKVCIPIQRKMASQVLSTMVFGRMVRDMDRERCNSQMEENIMEDGRMGLNMDVVLSKERMAPLMMDYGKWAREMVRGNLSQKMEICMMVCGKMTIDVVKEWRL